MQVLQSITRIEKILPTPGSRPVVVTCEDYNDYVCKYGRPHDLFNEYIAASFCRIWKIPVPDFRFVKVMPEHVKDGMARRLFEHTCHGSLYLEHALDVNNFLSTWGGLPRELAKIANSEDLLKIALFDLWLSNEDRNHNNFNLLINPESAGNIITAIDHVAIFNYNTLTHGMTQLSIDESIVSSEVFSMFFKRGARLVGLINDLEEKFYLYIEECRTELSNILSLVPKDWYIDIEEKQRLLLANIFSTKWLKETIVSLRLYLELKIK